jgi:hypothetical protein
MESVRTEVATIWWSTTKPSVRTDNPFRDRESNRSPPAHMSRTLLRHKHAALEQFCLCCPQLKLPWPESASELYRPSDRRLSPMLMPTFEDKGVSRGQHIGSPRLYFWFCRPEPLLFLLISSSIVLTGLSGPRSRLTTSQKIWYRREPNLGPLDL